MKWPSVWRLLDNPAGKSFLNSLSSQWYVSAIARAYFLRNRSELSPRARKLIQYSFPSQLLGEMSDKITIGIITTYQDSRFLNLSIIGIEEILGEKIEKLFLVCPKSDFLNMQKFATNRITILRDEDLLNDVLFDHLNRFPEKRRGWIKQQVLKMALVEYAATPATLLVDADTILLQKQNWFNSDGTQALAISDEFHQPYQSHLERFRTTAGINNVMKSRVSFVTHHQVMQKLILRKLFGTILNANCKSKIVTWLNEIDPKESSGACEWHTYGTFLLNENKKVNFYQWKNLAIPPEKLNRSITGNSKNDYLIIKKNYSGYNSISAHHYL